MFVYSVLFLFSAWNITSVLTWTIWQIKFTQKKIMNDY